MTTLDDVTIYVATYGSEDWRKRGDGLPMASAEAQGCKVVRVHLNTTHGLHHARNRALELVETPWCLALDGDDELEAGYVEAMLTGTADVRAPAVRYVLRGKGQPVRVPTVAGHTHACTAECLAYGNWLVIGSMVRTQLLRDVGGWHDYKWSEDWSSWARCWKAGASFEAIPSAIYRAHVSNGSRNRSALPAEKMAAHVAIATDLGLPIPGVDW